MTERFGITPRIDNFKIINSKTHRHLIGFSNFIVKTVSLFEQFFEIANLPVAIIINNGQLIRPCYSADILDQFSFKRKWIYQEQTVELVNVNSFAKKLAGRKDDLKMTGLDLFHFGLLASFGIVPVEGSFSPFMISRLPFPKDMEDRSIFLNQE